MEQLDTPQGLQGTSDTKGTPGIGPFGEQLNMNQPAEEVGGQQGPPPALKSE